MMLFLKSYRKILHLYTTKILHLYRKKRKSKKRILSTEAFEVVATLLSIPQRPDAAFEIAFCFFFSCSYKAILKENFISSKINYLYLF